MSKSISKIGVTSDGAQEGALVGNGRLKWGGEWLYVLLIFILALSVRIALVFVQPNPQGMELIMQTMEPGRIAASLLRNGTYADAYGDDVGPTAHCLPLHPLILAGLIHLFGQGPAGILALQVMSSSAAALGYALLPVVTVVWRLGLLPGVMAGVAGALLPVNFWTQTSGTFDAPLTFLALTVLVCVLGRWWCARSFPMYGAVVVGCVAGLACLLNAAVLPVLCAWGALGVWHFSEQRSVFIRFAAVAAGVVVLMLAPWAIRNYFTLGEMVWTRSNFGLELHLSNNDFATGDADRNVREEPFNIMHPLQSGVEREKVRSMGELRYHAQQREQALQWIRENPERFVQLSLARVRNFWFPPMLRWWQTAVEAAITLGGLAGLVSLARRRQEAFWVLGAMLFGYSAIYTIIQVSARYRYPVEGFLLVLCCYWLCMLWWREKVEA